MKKSSILAGILALASVAAVAAPIKTSKAMLLSDAQMASVKGEGIITIWVWTTVNGVWIPSPANDGTGHYEGGYSYYVLAQTIDTGPTGPGMTHVLGGPNGGVYGPGYHP